MRLFWMFLLLSSSQQPTLLCQQTSNPAGIKGSENPERIPDEVAIGLLFVHLSDGPRGMSWADRASFLSPSGMSERQITTFLNTANTYTAKVSEIANRIRDLKANNPRPLTGSAADQLDGLLAEQLAERTGLVISLKTALGPEGTDKLYRFVQTGVKPSMVYYPGK